MSAPERPRARSRPPGGPLRLGADAVSRRAWLAGWRGSGWGWPPPDPSRRPVRVRWAWLAAPRWRPRPGRPSGWLERPRLHPAGTDGAGEAQHLLSRPASGDDESRGPVRRCWSWSGRRKPGRLIVGDQTFYVQNTAANMRRAGLEEAVRAHGAEFVAFDDLPAPAPPARRRRGTGPMDTGSPRCSIEVDHVVNLACVKTHCPGPVHDGDEELHRGDRRGQPTVLPPDTRSEQGYDAFAALMAEMSLAFRASLQHPGRQRRPSSAGGPSDGTRGAPAGS